MRWWALLAAGAALLCAVPANAALRLCNRTSYVVYAAVASADGANVSIQGWTRIVPGACQVPIKGDLVAPQYFVYARSSLAHTGPGRAWGGASSLCVKDADFALRLSVGKPRCPDDDSFMRPFASLNTHHMRSWTLTFNAAPPEPGRAAAEKDGWDRLLRDNDLAPGDARGLEALRKRLHIAAGTSRAQLFDALETEALKNAAPAGYTVCNDGAALVLVALGQRAGTIWRARGWWKISAGSCAKTLDTAPGSGKIYLLAEKQSGAVLVGGTDKFCITSVEFDIQGRDACAARGLITAGFAVSDTRGAAGYVVHIGDHGLVPGAKRR
jgi:uncharacterized membrane protein